MIRINRWLWLLALVLLAACSPVQARQGGLPFTILEQKNDAAYIGQTQYYALEPGLMVFPDRESAEEGGVFFSEAGRTRLSQVRWQTQFVVAVFQGWKSRGGYGVTIERVDLLENTIVVRAAFSSPGDDPPPAVTSPYAAIVLGRPAAPLVVELWVGEERLAVYPEPESP